MNGFFQRLRHALVGHRPHAERNGPAIALHRCHQQVAYAMQRSVSFVQIRIEKQHDKLITSESRDQVACAELAFQDFGNRSQGTISFQVSAFVVDLLEVIEIHIGEGDRSIGTVRECQQQVTAFIKCPAV